MRSTQHSPSLRSRYDYYYSSPTSTSTATVATNFYENQHASLFGDPVPPSTGFLENLDNHLYGSFKRCNRNRSHSAIFDNFPTSRYFQTERDELNRPESRYSERLSRPNLIEDSIYGSRISSALSNDFRSNLDNFR